MNLDGLGANGSRQGLLQAAMRNLGWLLASRGVLALLSLLYLGIATRTLGMADFGRFALITGAAQGLAVLVGFQTWQVVVRFGIEHRARGDEEALGRLNGACVLLDLGSAVVGVAIAAVILLTFSTRMGIAPALLRDTAVLTAVQLLTVRSAAVGILRLSDRFREAALADSVTPAVRLIGAVLAAALLPTLHAFLWAWTLAEVATAAAYWLLLWRSGDVALMRRSAPDRRLVGEENPQIGRFLINSNVLSSLGLASKHLPLLFVGAFVGPAAAGAFRVALQVAQALSKLAQLIARAAFPEVVKAVRQASQMEVAAALGRMFVASLAGGAVILVLLVVLGRQVLVLVGGDAAYGEAYGLLLWLAVAGSIDLAAVGFEPVLLAADRSVGAMGARAAGVAAQVAASLLLLPRVGAVGASVGVLCASLSSALLLGSLVLRFAGYRARD